jgi:hypothetical protein
MMEKEPSLKPCPFCGKVVMVIEKAGGLFAVALKRGPQTGCYIAHGLFPQYANRARLVRGWNKRRKR